MYYSRRPQDKMSNSADVSIMWTLLAWPLGVHIRGTLLYFHRLVYHVEKLDFYQGYLYLGPWFLGMRICIDFVLIIFYKSEMWFMGIYGCSRVLQIPINEEIFLGEIPFDISMPPMRVPAANSCPYERDLLTTIPHWDMPSQKLTLLISCKSNHPRLSSGCVKWPDSPYHV